MSHFTVMVIGDAPEKQLAPYEEELETPRYVEFTKAQLIEKEKKRTQAYKNGMYSEYLADPEKYFKEYGSNAAHIKYITEEFPKELLFSDDEYYQKAIKYYDADEIGSEGEVYSTRNPNAKWDWFQLGGRWSGLIKLRNGANGKTGRGSLVHANEAGIDQAIKKDIDNFNELKTFAILKDGNWYERGEMGWWGVVHDEKDEKKWDEEFSKLIADLPDDTLISIYDCHI